MRKKRTATRRPNVLGSIGKSMASSHRKCSSQILHNLAETKVYIMIWIRCKYNAFTHTLQPFDIPNFRKDYSGGVLSNFVKILSIKFNVRRIGVGPISFGTVLAFFLNNK